MYDERWSQAVKKGGSFVDSRTAHLLFRLMARIMDSPLRYRLSDPFTILEGAGLLPGQEVLEIGCGTGFFTISAAEMVGDEGHVYAMDPHPLAVEHVTRKIQDSGRANVRLIKADATKAGLVNGCIDLALLLGVIPAPIIPLDRLLPEIYRLLRPEGALAVWTVVPWWSPTSLTRSGLFVCSGKEKGVYSFRRAASN
jgi:demethylmenaquinone methyltransferase/2-methoxy-6-polyprenyl-1,4-benzoquinol methylase